jgi:membrane protease YdiL (CAAX protease family)
MSVVSGVGALRPTPMSGETGDTHDPAEACELRMTLAEPPSRRPVELAFAAEMALGAVAIVLGHLVGVQPLKGIFWSAADVALGLLAAMPMVALLLVALWRATGPLARITKLVEQLVNILFASATILDVAAVSAAAGFGEELLFRGLIQSGTERLTGSATLAVAIGAVLFGAAHPITRTYALLAAVIGAYFGWLFVAAGNLLVPIVAHGAYDLVAILIFRRADSAREQPRFDEREKPRGER